MTNAELEVIEAAFSRPLRQIAIQTPGMSSIAIPITPDFQSNIASKSRDSLYGNADYVGMVKDGTRVDHVLSGFSTKMYQLDNALKSSLDLGVGKHWSHVLPGVLRDHSLEIGKEAQAIEASFDR
jgi:hypothetical protein